MESRSVRHTLRARLRGLSLVMLGLTGCIEGVVEAPEDELGEDTQEAVSEAPSERILVDLDGARVGDARTSTGGVRVVNVAAVASEQTFLKKSVQSVSIEALTLNVPFATFVGFQGWVDATWNGKVVRKDGAITFASVDGKVQRATEFHDALLTEVTFPALDASSKDVLSFVVKAAPQQVVDVAAGGTASLGTSRGKSASAANFRLTIPGLDCSRVTRIDSFTVKSPGAPELGSVRDVVSAPTDFPTLRVTLSAQSVKSWSEHQSRVLADGQITDAEELSGLIEFLSADLKTVLGTVSLEGLGIKRLAQADGAAATTQVHADLYVEKLAFSAPTR